MPVFRKLLPLLAVIFVSYWIIGIAMPVLPLYVHDALGLSHFMVGLVAGSQFAASLFSRPLAGHYADSRGTKPTMIIGLLVAAASGVLYLVSDQFRAQPEVAVTILLLGRAALGIAESFIITAALSWGISLLEAQNAGRVMAFVGTALYAAYAAGAPAGMLLYESYGGFRSIGLAAVLVPLAALPFVMRFPSAARPRPSESSFRSVVSAVWQPGLGVALAGVSYGAVTAFIGLFFAERGWRPAWLALTLLSVAFVICRLTLGYLPDRIGGAKVALVSILTVAAGQALIWAAPQAWFAFAGVALTGFGYSLVYPGFGLEALRRTPPQNRGLALGTYTAFLDLSLGFSGPALGWIANQAGLRSVYLASAIIVLCASVIAVRLLRAGRLS